VTRARVHQGWTISGLATLIWAYQNLGRIFTTSIDIRIFSLTISPKYYIEILLIISKNIYFIYRKITLSFFFCPIIVSTGRNEKTLKVRAE